MSKWKKDGKETEIQLTNGNKMDIIRKRNGNTSCWDG